MKILKEVQKILKNWCLALPFVSTGPTGKNGQDGVNKEASLSNLYFIRMNHIYDLNDVASKKYPI